MTYKYMTKLVQISKANVEERNKKTNNNILIPKLKILLKNEILNHINKSLNLGYNWDLQTLLYPFFSMFCLHFHIYKINSLHGFW